MLLLRKDGGIDGRTREAAHLRLLQANAQALFLALVFALLIALAPMVFAAHLLAEPSGDFSALMQWFWSGCFGLWYAYLVIGGMVVGLVWQVTTFALDFLVAAPSRRKTIAALIVGTYIFVPRLSYTRAKHDHNDQVAVVRVLLHEGRQIQRVVPADAKSRTTVAVGEESVVAAGTETAGPGWHGLLVAACMTSPSTPLSLPRWSATIEKCTQASDGRLLIGVMGTSRTPAFSDSLYLVEKSAVAIDDTDIW